MNDNRSGAYDGCGKRKRVKYQCLHVGLHGADSLWKLMLDSFLKNYTRD